MMRLIYVAGKYKADTQEGVAENIHHAARVGFELWEKGWAVITPHLNTTFSGIAEFAEIQMKSMWLWGDLRIVEACDAIIMLDNWKDSNGAKVEKAYAEYLGKEIFYEEMGIP